MDERRGSDHAAQKVGEYCETCETRHKRLKSLPDKPLTDTLIDKLEESSGVYFARGVDMATGKFAGVDTDDFVSENIIISTETETKLVSRHEGHGWIIEFGFPHEEVGEDPRSNGQIVWMDASQKYSEDVLSGRIELPGSTG